MTAPRPQTTRRSRHWDAKGELEARRIEARRLRLERDAKVVRPCDTWALGSRADALTDKGYCRFCFEPACTHGVRDATLEHAAVLDVALALREQYQQTVLAPGFRRGQDFQPGDRIHCGGQDWIVVEYDGTLYMTEHGIIDPDWRYSPVEHGCHYKVAVSATPVQDATSR